MEKVDTKQPSAWEQVFRASKANGGPYYGDLLKPQYWEFPKRTWFQRRLKKVRRELEGYRG